MYYAFKVFDGLLFSSKLLLEMMIKVLRKKILLATVCWRLLTECKCSHGEDHTKTKRRREFFIMARL